MANSDTPNKMGKWIDGLKAEFRKILWPTREDVTKETTAVLTAAVAVGAIIALLDFVVQHGIDFLVNIKF